jgi:hypothetical protein
LLETLPTTPTLLAQVIAMKVYERDVLEQVTWKP